MAKIIASEYAPLDNIEMRTRNPIRASNWREIAEGQNLLLSRQGARLGGVHLEDFGFNQGEPFKSTSTNYTVESSGTLRLDEWLPTCLFNRAIKDDIRFITVEALGTNFNLEVKATRQFPSAGDTITQFINAISGWGSTTFTIAEAFIDPYSSGGNQQIEFSFRVKLADAGELELHAINIYEGAITPSQLP